MTCRLGQGLSELEKNVWEKACERFRPCSSLTQTARYPRQRPESQGITPSKPHPKLLPPLECLLPAAPSLQLSQGTSTNTCCSANHSWVSTLQSSHSSGHWSTWWARQTQSLPSQEVVASALPSMTCPSSALICLLWRVLLYLSSPRRSQLGSADSIRGWVCPCLTSAK